MSTPLLKTEGLGIQFGGLKAVDEFNFEINKNQLYGLIGPNGAGKTTVFNLLTGVYQPTSGRILFEGQPIKKANTIKITKAGIARTFQNIRLFKEMSVIDNVKVGLHYSHPYTVFDALFHTPKYKKAEAAMQEEALSLLRVFHLEEFAESKAKNLPYGKQRKLEIARALATNPKLLLLDEPAAGMNPHETKELVDIVKYIRDEFDLTILLIEHDMKFVSGLCDEITVLNFGTVLAQGETKKALSDPEVIKAYIGG